MPFNVLFLPLLGGYLFITLWNRTRFQTKRHSGHRLLFHSAFFGVVFLLLAFLFSRGLTLMFPRAASWWHSRVPFSYAGTSLLALTFGSVLWIPLNRWISLVKKEAKRAIEEANDYLEMLLLQAIEETKMVMLSLKSGKVYIGLIIRNFDPAYDRKYVAVLPMRSGFRQEDLTVKFTTDYAQVYQQIVDQKVDVVDDDFQIVVPVSEIESAHLFSPNAYKLFHQMPTAH